MKRLGNKSGSNRLGFATLRALTAEAAANEDPSQGQYSHHAVVVLGALAADALAAAAAAAAAAALALKCNNTAY
ncbi:hypothetical protein ABT272_41240 [Streptomyces sp900105245]|uniref:Uncharacterized protein n=1 Tax=Streptomyces sp. 900105245 TaxID=3154379 RepID=A0ABV1UK28_9ACTN